MYKFALLKHIFYPSACLQLRVNHHGILQSFSHDEGTINGDGIFWQAVANPISNLQVVPHDIS